MANEADRPLERVTEGVFFTTPSVLPRGRHELPRGVVVAAQSERAMIAATELLAAHGYRGVGVREIAARAAISRGAFYECFEDKDACVFAAYDRFSSVLVARLAERLETERGDLSWPDYVSWVLTGYLEGLQRDLVVARAFLVELDSLGRPARLRRRRVIQGFAEVLHTRRQEADPDTPVPLTAYISALAAVRQLASDVVDGLDVPEGAGPGPEPDLLALVPEMRGWLDQMLAPPSGSLR